MNFYLCKAVTMTKDSNPSERMVMTQAQRYITEDWTYTKEDGATIPIKFPKLKYDFPMEIVYDQQANPTMALIRTEGTLDVSDFNINMTTKGEAAWQQMYATYPNLAAHPYADALYQP